MEQQSEDNSLVSAMEGFGNTLLRLLQTQLDERRPIEERWVEEMRRYKSKYEDQVYTNAKEQKLSSVFVGYTRSKTDSWVAQMTDMLYPADDKNYGILPTPVPELDKELEQDPDLQGDAAALAKAEKDEAVAIANAMETQIDDQLLECDFATEGRWMLHYSGVLGTGIIRAPEVQVKSEAKWAPVEHTQSGEWAAQIGYKQIPVARCVMPWDFVPDMSATNLDDAEFVFERSYVNKKSLRSMLNDESKEKTNIVKLLKQEPKSTHAHTGDVLGYVNQLRMMTGLQPTYKESRYEMWVYHGPIPHMVLVEAGLLEPDELSDVMEIDGVVHFAGDGTVVSVNLNPFDTEDWPYSVYCCEPDVSCIFGYGIPHLCKDSQDILNTAWRSMLDNGVTTVGDQIVVNKSVLQPADGNWEFSPRKVWQTTDSTKNMATFEAQKAFGVFSFQSRQQEFANVISMAKSFMDEESGLPMISQGEQGQVTPTLGGMSMLMNAANAVRRRQVKEFDDAVTKPLISRFYAWNMQFNPRPEIKGDMNVVARGTSALLVKEMQTAQIIEMFDRFSAHPNLAPAFDWYKGVESLVKSMSLGVQTMLKPKSEYDQVIKQQQEQAQNQPQDPTIVKAQMDLELQQLKHQQSMELERLKSEMDMQVEQLKMQGNVQTQEQRNQEIIMKHELELAKLTQQKEIKLYELSQQDKWNTEKLVTELRKLRSQQELDMNKFVSELKLKQMPVSNPTSNYGLE